MSLTRPRPGRAGWLAPVLAACLLVTVSGCSDDGDTTGGTAAWSAGTGAPNGVGRTTVRVGEVAGRLSPRQRRQVRTEVGRLVDRWWTSAWFEVDRAGRRGRSAYPGFTPAAARLARRDRGMLSAWTLGRRADELVPRVREVAVDVLAPGGRPAAATARMRLAVAGWDAGEARRTGTVRMRGRLFLTPRGRGWQVFGYDVATDGLRGRR